MRIVGEMGMKEGGRRILAVPIILCPGPFATQMEHPIEGRLAAGTRKEIAYMDWFVVDPVQMRGSNGRHHRWREMRDFGEGHEGLSSAPLISSL
jgi:hypothetical protein